MIKLLMILFIVFLSYMPEIIFSKINKLEKQFISLPDLSVKNRKNNW